MVITWRSHATKTKICDAGRKGNSKTPVAGENISPYRPLIIPFYPIRWLDDYSNFLFHHSWNSSIRVCASSQICGTVKIGPPDYATSRRTVDMLLHSRGDIHIIISCICIWNGCGGDGRLQVGCIIKYLGEFSASRYRCVHIENVTL